MAELYHLASRKNTVKKAIDDLKNKLKVAEANAKSFSHTMDMISEKQKTLKAYLGLEKFKSDVVTPLAQTPQKTAKAFLN